MTPYVCLESSTSLAEDLNEWKSVPDTLYPPLDCTNWVKVMFEMIEGVAKWRARLACRSGCELTPFGVAESQLMGTEKIRMQLVLIPGFRTPRTDVIVHRTFETLPPFAAITAFASIALLLAFDRA